MATSAVGFFCESSPIPPYKEADMAKIFIIPDDYENADDAMDRAIEVKRESDETGGEDTIYGICPRCHSKITNRGNFEDTTEVITIHVDNSAC